MRKLNDVCNVITCGVAKRPQYVENGIPFLSSKNVKENRFILDSYNFVSQKDFESLTKHNKPENGDILYTRVGSFGEAAIIDLDFEFAIFVSLTLIKPKHDIIYNRYLMYYLNSPDIKHLAKSSTSGIGVQNLNVKVVREFPIKLPPLETQKKIAAILDEADKLRQLDQQLIEKYDELTQSLFLDMFGEKGKYKQVIIEDLVTKITDGTHHTPKYTDSGVPFLRVTDITKSNDSKKFISRDEHEQLIKRCNPEKGDVLYTKNGTIGIAKLVDWDYEFSIFVSLCLLKPRHDLIHNKFLESFLNTPFALKQAMRHSKTGTITNLHLTEIKKIKIPLPSMEIQLEFVNKVQAIDAQKALAQKSLEKSEELFNSLLQKAFKGELV